MALCAVMSSCLLGAPCRYDGGSKPIDEVIELARKVDVVRVCPETASGLPVPRPPAEQLDGRVLLADGRDVTPAFVDWCRPLIGEELRRFVTFKPQL